jgi:hypothetical protein
MSSERNTCLQKADDAKQRAAQATEPFMKSAYEKVAEHRAGQALQPSWQSPHRSLHDQPLADQKDVKPSIGQTDGITTTRSLALTSRWALSATVGAGSAPCRHRGSVGSVLQAAATCPRTAGPSH